MKTIYKVILACLIILAATALAMFYISSHDILVLNPKGIIGMKERDLIVTASSLMLIVVIPVFAFTIYFSWKYRKSNDKARHEPDWEHNNIAELCWWGVPLVIIVVLAVLTWRTTHELDPFKPLQSEKKPLVVQAVALQWKWLFIYPEQKIATLNYLQIPEKRPINFRITADAPMNSFWIPQLGGQIYAMPGMRAKLHLMASETGVYMGRSSNFSGKGFAGMTFNAVATTEQDFQTWVNSVQGSSATLDWSDYERLVKPSENNAATAFGRVTTNLFDKILEKYEKPATTY